MTDMQTDVPLLEFVQDDLGDDFHKSLDKMLFAAFTSVDYPTEVTAREVIAQLVRDLPARLDQKYSNEVSERFALFRAYPQLEGLVSEAWASGSFRKIRSLKILQNQVKLIPVNADQKAATEKAWKAPFVGRIHEHMLEEINKMKYRDEHYGNSLPIIQSSGTGKSRTVDELARLVFTIPLNLRGDIPNNYAFPPADQEVVSFFTSPVKTWNAGIVLHCVFLKHLFRAVRFYLIEHYTKFLSYADLAGAWRKDLWDLSARKELYEGAIKKANEDQRSEGLLQEVEDEATLLIETIDSIVEKTSTDNSVRLVLYFDEAHTLVERVISEDDNGRNLYDALSKALCCLVNTPTFAITLSTNSKLSTFSPSRSRHPSARIVHEVIKYPLQAPWTELYFDCFELESLVQPGGLTLFDTAQTKFMVKFGRPLFYTRWRSGIENVQALTVEFAREKLIGSRDQLEYVYLAVLGVRLLLELEPKRQKAIFFESQLVAEHMRIAYSVPHHREYFRSGYPSEPILAEAAAQEMGDIRKKTSIPTILVGLLNDDFLEKGESGELVMRLLLTEAYDKAANRKNYSDPVHLFAFLEALFGKAHFDIIRKSHPDNQDDGSARDFETQFQHAYVRFTHFARNGTDNGTTTRTAWAAIVRGMAIQCSKNYHVIDAVLPIAICPKGVRVDKLDEDNMTAILIQVKNKERYETLAFDESQVGFFPKNSTSPRPYITLVMQLGVRTTARTSDRMTIPVEQARRSRPSRATPSKHPRFPISVTGCSSSSYAVVENKDEYALLLGARDMLREHPRQNAELLSVVRRMKPFWNRGPDSYDWTTDPVLNRRKDEGQVEGLVVGWAAVDGSVPMDED